MMQAIATLVHDDPYLRTPKHERIAARKARRQLFAGLIAPPRSMPVPEPVIEKVAEPAQQDVADPFALWTEKQLEKYRVPWFSILEEPEPPAPPSVEAIQLAACQFFGVRRADIKSARRTANIVRPRQTAMYLAKQLTGLSLPQIGRLFGGRDHTTVLHAVRKIERLTRADWTVAYDVAHVEAML